MCVTGKIAMATALALLSVFVLRLPFQVKGETVVSAKSCVLYNPQTDVFLFRKDADRKRPMASPTTMMPALTAVDVLSADTVITVPQEAVGVEGTSMYLSAGEELTFDSLLYGLLLQSANDAAVTIALACDGSISAFADRMNLKARELSLASTHFTNPHGLPDGDHYTTAGDLAILAAKFMENPYLVSIVSTKNKKVVSSKRTRYFKNHNKLLFLSDFASGVKTGYTKESGRCLVGAAQKDGVNLISVTLNAPSDWNDHLFLWDFGFSVLENKKLIQKGEYSAVLP
ncbi:MAG: D-alanyl-D-alanine carboxypeptidase, partial [Clostridia bacterium]|nr:D-alanyl-D-alanine carboxypeptidase [Clostridia bacterium]